MGTKRGTEHKYDNLLTVVAEHVGTLVRFNPRFLAFARECNFYPRACNPAAGWEKGKVERGGVGYVRQNFWPLPVYRSLRGQPPGTRVAEPGRQPATSPRNPPTTL